MLIGDELLSALDLASKTDLIGMLDRYREKHGACVVLITHEVRPQALRQGQILHLSAKSRPHPEELSAPAKSDYWYPTV